MRIDSPMAITDNFTPGVSVGAFWVKNSKDPIEHRNVLAVHYIHKNPGLLPVLQALKRFRKLAETSLVAPAKMFDTAPWEK